MTLTKNELTESLYEKIDLPKKRNGRILETLLELIKSTLKNGDDVMITGFGKFRVREKKPRKGRNPESGNELMLEARRVVTFKCSNVLKEKLNK